MLRIRERLDMKTALKLSPVRAPGVTMQKTGDGLRLTVRLLDTLPARLLRVFFTLPQEKSFVLDPFGASVWNACDGRTPAGTIAAILAGEHGWARHDAERAVLLFLSTLSERRLVSFGTGGRNGGR